MNTQGQTASKLPLSAVELVSGSTTLASPPELYLSARKLTENPKSSAEDIGAVVATDPGMTARLLAVVNSPFYGFPSRIDTIPRAIGIIGTSALLQLILVTTVIKAFNNTDSRINIRSFWAHSLQTGLMARALAARENRVTQDVSFVGGLLHDIGRLVMLVGLPGPERNTLIEAAEQTLSLAATERELLGFDHADVGGELARQWRLPETIEQVLEFHHQPDKALAHQELCRRVHAADVIVRARMDEDPSRAGGMDQALSTIYVPEETVVEVVEEVQECFGEAYRSFFGQQPPA